MTDVGLAEIRECLLRRRTVENVVVSVVMAF